MEHIYQQIQTDIDNILWEWEESGYLHSGDVFVVGCSTSEIIGKDIGSAGSEEVASILFEAFNAFRKKTGVHLVFQCCEHLNRALVIERTALDSLKTPLEEVSVIPAPEAGGSMATYAYRHMDDAVVVETMQADVGMDIGDTLIGMQLKR